MLNYLSPAMKFQDIITQLGKVAKTNSLSQNQNLNPEIKGVAAIDEADSGALSYVEGGEVCLNDRHNQS